MPAKSRGQYVGTPSTTELKVRLTIEPLRKRLKDARDIADDLEPIEKSSLTKTQKIPAHEMAKKEMNMSKEASARPLAVPIDTDLDITAQR